MLKGTEVIGLNTLSSGQCKTNRLVLCGPFCLASMPTFCQSLSSPLEKVCRCGAVLRGHIVALRLHSGFVGLDDPKST